jgi:hypothetical protein
VILIIEVSITLRRTNSTVSFLDIQNQSHIDATIEKKKRLIELLKRKRHGNQRSGDHRLMPKCYENSGIDWLGKFYHWNLPLRQFYIHKIEVA